MFAAQPTNDSILTPHAVEVHTGFPDINGGLKQLKMM